MYLLVCLHTHHPHCFQTPNLTLTRSATRVDFSHHVIFALSTLSLAFESSMSCLKFNQDERYNDIYHHQHWPTTRNAKIFFADIYFHNYKNYLRQYHQLLMCVDELENLHYILYFITHSYFYFVHCNHSFCDDVFCFHLHLCYWSRYTSYHLCYHYFTIS